MNRFGEAFSITTFGESHGRAIGCIVDGVPAGFRDRFRFYSIWTRAYSAR